MSRAFTIWTLPCKTRCLEDTESRGMMFLTGNLDIVGAFFHGPDCGQARLFDANHWSAPPYLITRRNS